MFHGRRVPRSGAARRATGSSTQPPDPAGLDSTGHRHFDGTDLVFAKCRVGCFGGPPGQIHVYNGCEVRRENMQIHLLLNSP